MREYVQRVEKTKHISSLYISKKERKCPTLRMIPNYISADSRVSSTPEQAVEKSLEFESASNTGAGCNQAPENVVTPEE